MTISSFYSSKPWPFEANRCDTSWRRFCMATIREPQTLRRRGAKFRSRIASADNILCARVFCCATMPVYFSVLLEIWLFCRPMMIRRVGVAIIDLGQQRCHIDEFFILQLHWFAFSFLGESLSKIILPTAVAAETLSASDTCHAFAPERAPLMCIVT